MSLLVLGFTFIITVLYHGVGIEIHPGYTFDPSTSVIVTAFGLITNLVGQLLTLCYGYLRCGFDANLVYQGVRNGRFLTHAYQWRTLEKDENGDGSKNIAQAQ